MRFAPPKVGQVRLRAGRFCFGRAGRCSALTRRNAILLHGVVNCGPAKGYVWPVLAPAEGLVRAGTVLRGGAVLLRRAAPGLCLSLRFCCNVLPSVHAGYAVLSKCLAFGSRLLFDAERQTGRLAVSCVPIPPWVEIAIRAFSRRSSVICLCGFTSGLAVSLWRSRRGYDRSRLYEKERRFRATFLLL